MLMLYRIEGMLEPGGGGEEIVLPTTMVDLGSKSDDSQTFTLGTPF